MCTRGVAVRNLLQRLHWQLLTERIRYYTCDYATTGTPTHTPNCTVVRLDTGELAKLRTKMKQGSARASTMCATVRNVVEGRVEGHFYTDGWPEFTTVVFQCLQPRLSDVCDLHCYTTSKQQLHCVLEQARLVTKGQWQYIQIVEDDDITVTDYIVQNIRPDGVARLNPDEYTVYKYGMYAPVGQLPTTSLKCPVGYRLGELAVEHSTLVSSQAGAWIASIGRPASVAEQYFRECIQRLHSAAAYCDSDPTTPVAWCVEFAMSGDVSNLFTLEGHRRKGLGTAVKRALCQKQLSQGDIPYSVVVDGSPASSTNWQSKLGFQYVGRMRGVFVLNHC